MGGGFTVASRVFGRNICVTAFWDWRRISFSAQGIFRAISPECDCASSLVLPPVVTGYVLLVVFGRQGVLGAPLDLLGISFSFRWTGAALAAAIMAFPLMVRAIRLAIEAVDQGLEDAAATLGANPMRVFLTVTLPLSLPGIIAGSVLAFAKAMGEFGATITFVSNIPGETRTIPSAIYTFLQVPGGETSVARLVVFSVVLAFGALAVSEIMARRARHKVGGA